MKYKVGDKFLQEIEIRQIIDPLKFGKQYVMSGLQYANDDDLDKLRRLDDMTVEEAWKLAEKIMEMPYGELAEIFPECEGLYIMRNFPPQEVKAKIESWEAEKEIKVGDVVTGCAKQPGVVTLIKSDYIIVMWFDGSYSTKTRNDIKQTGRHIDIQSVFEQIEGAE